MEDILVPRRRQWKKPGTAILTGRRNPIEHHRVEMHICNQDVSKTLHERHGATLRGTQTQQELGSLPQLSK